MPLITSSSGFQIHGGNFYDVSGDMNIHSTQSVIGLSNDPLTVLESGLTASSRRLVGPQRNGRQIEAARMMPYGPPRRPSLQERSHGSCNQLPPSAAIPSLPGPSQTHSERRAIEYPSSHHQDRGRSPQGDRNRLDPPPIPLGRRAIQFLSTHDQDGRPPQGDVSESSYPARDHRMHINIGGNVNQIQYNGGGFHVLHNVAAADAFHDSAERFPQPRCHPETRTKMLEDLWKWSSETDSDRTVCWLHGPAGAGKSAIAQSFCAKLAAQKRLAASFFFKRGHPSRGNGKKLFTTVAYQLAFCRPELKTAISRIVEDDLSVIHRALSGAAAETDN
ncbi:AAA-16 domain-containing protein [Mycena sanguinolenta]|uniref:AAA-16 domain-containing protein n=1 Tax=Mycena sanguinolenta TaxID=230812 RepID=A0A8H6WXR4_9AGAR|nr:AAA-16 domain-containing protein [Mycena sanguinolenta]